MQYLWLGMSILGAYFLLVFILMEFAISEDPENPGNLKAKKDGFVLKYFYQGNMVLTVQGDWIEYPKDLCGLFWGLVLGIAVTLVFSVAFSVFATIIILAIAVGGVILSIIGMLLGKILKIKSYIKDPNNSEFYQYQRFGSNNQYKYPAPWKILVIAIPFLVTYSTGDPKWIGYAAIIVSALICSYIFCKIVTKPVKKAGSVTLAFFKAIKNKTCPLIRVD